MAITKGNVTSGSGEKVSSITISHTISSGDDRLLLVSVRNDGSDPSTVQYGGVSLTKLANYDYGNKGSLWYLKNPAVGTANIVLDWGSSSWCYPAVMAINLYGVDQTTTFRTVTNAGTNGTSISNTIESETDDLVVDFMGNRSTGGGVSNATLTSGDTDEGNVISPSSINGMNLGTKAGASGTTTMSWTFSNSYCRQLAVAVIPKPPSTSVTIETGAQVVTSSIPNAQVNLGVGISPVAQVGNFSLPANSILLGVGISPNAQVGTFSTPTPEILTPDALVSPTTQVATFALETPTLNLDAVIAIANELVATLSLPTPAILQGVGISPDAQVATFSIQTPEFITQIIVEVNVQEGTFSIPTASVAIGIQIEPGAQVGTFSTPVPSILYDMVFGVDPIVATFEVKDPLIRASNYQTKYPVRGNTYGVKYT